jgi:TrpR family trp operon transcriptional repressor
MSDFSSFINIVYAIRDKSSLEDFLIGITTPKERIEFAPRVEIVKLLLAGTPQAKIAKELGVGVATVTRGSKELAQGRFKALRK